MSHKSGFVLVTVLWVLAILAVISLGFGRRAMLERQKAWYVLDHEQALQMARGAVELAIVELRNKAVLDDYHGQSGYTGRQQRWARPVDLLRKRPYYALARDANFKNDQCTYRIYDSMSRISLNEAPEELLEGVEGLTRKMIRSIMKRRDPPAGQLSAQRFHSVEELRLLDDVDDAVWYGDKDYVGLRNMLTVAQGTGSININTASRDVLNAIPELEEQIVDAIITYRARKSIKNIRNLAFVLDVSAEKIAPLQKYCTEISNRFTVQTHATRRHGKIHAYCTANVTVEGSIIHIESWNEDSIGT